MMMDKTCKCGKKMYGFSMGEGKSVWYCKCSLIARNYDFTVKKPVATPKLYWETHTQRRKLVECWVNGVSLEESLVAAGIERG